MTPTHLRNYDQLRKRNHAIPIAEDTSTDLAGALQRAKEELCGGEYQPQQTTTRIAERALVRHQIKRDAMYVLKLAQPMRGRVLV